MGEEKMEVEETTLPEENQEVDASIQLCHKIFALSNPSQGTDVAALGDEVKQIVLDRGASRDAATPSRAMCRFQARHAPETPPTPKHPTHTTPPGPNAPAANPRSMMPPA